MNGACLRCRFWTGFVTKENHGHCRRYPPVIWRDQYKEGDFPITKAGDWCGEFQEREVL